MKRGSHIRPVGNSSTPLGLANNYWNDLHAAMQRAGASVRKKKHELAAAYLDENFKKKAIETIVLLRALEMPKDAKELERRVAKALASVRLLGDRSSGHGLYRRR
jgi:hypothetical protein